MLDTGARGLLMSDVEPTSLLVGKKVEIICRMCTMV